MSTIDMQVLEERYEEHGHLLMDEMPTEEAAAIQAEIEELLETCNTMVRLGTYRDRESGEYDLRYLAAFEDAVTMLEDLAGYAMSW